jgi:predicted PhzF superfamily epimerase YddE/YHI9
MKVLRVFVDEDGNYGNPVGIIIDEGKKISDNERQETAKQSGFSEIVFINNIKQCDVSIFTPLRQIKFAGHALVGAAKYLSELNNKIITGITSQNNNIGVEYENNMFYVHASIDILPEWNFEQVNSVGLVESIKLSDFTDKKHTMVWAWMDENKGIVRARTFASDWGIPEDEANGSGAIMLSHKLKRDLKIIHGKGSIIYAKYVENNLGLICGKII